MKLRISIAAVVLGLVCGFATAQDLSLEGHANATLQTVKDANGQSTALQVSTAGVASTGTFAITGAFTQTGALQLNNTFTMGVNDTGYDFTLFGATAGKRVLWDESADTLDVQGTTQLDGTLTVGINDTGWDVIFYGATSGREVTWDESADELIVDAAFTVANTTRVEIPGYGASEVILCGQLGNSTTITLGPAVNGWLGDGVAYLLGDAQCDALDNATEATADAPLLTNVAFNVNWMYCKVSSAGSNGVVFTARSAEADLDPSLTCTVATGATDCLVKRATDTSIAAGATIAVNTVTTEDLSAQDGWCKFGVTF